MPPALTWFYASVTVFAFVFAMQLFVFLLLDRSAQCEPFVEVRVNSLNPIDTAELPISMDLELLVEPNVFYFATSSTTILSPWMPLREL